MYHKQLIIVYDCKVIARKSHYPKDGPWGVPDGWAWSTLGEVCSKVVDGDHNPPPSEPTPTEYLMISSKNVLDGRLDELKEVRYLSRSVFEECNKRTRLMRGDILLTTVGTLGRSCIYDGNRKIVLQRSVSVLTPLVSSEYIKCYLDSGHFQRHIDNNARGTAQKGFYLSLLEATIIPIPPLNEQQLIVAKASSLLSELNRIDNESGVIQDRISQAKSRILDLAIHGKLVPQDSTDEPAIEHLKRINPGFQPSHNLHYDSIPLGWEECTIGDIVEILNGYAFKSNDYSLKGIRVIRITNVQSGYMSDDEPKFFPEQRKSEVIQYLLVAGDLLMSLTGNVGRVAFIEEDYLPAALNQRVACLRSRSNRVILEYLFYLLQTEQFTGDCIASGKGVAQLNISTEWLKKYPILLPPICEQERIVSYIRRLLGILKDVANRI